MKRPNGYFRSRVLNWTNSRSLKNGYRLNKRHLIYPWLGIFQITGHFRFGSGHLVTSLPIFCFRNPLTHCVFSIH